MDDESLLSFPCDLPIKVLGRNDAAFRTATLAIVRRHFPELGDERVTEQRSRAASYLSLTVTVRAECRADVDALYRELTAEEAILMVL